MTIQETLLEFSPYNIDFKMQNGWFIIGLNYSSEWSIIEPQNKNIEHVVKDNRHYYGAKLEDNKLLDETFELIRSTIIYNKDLEKKVELFQEKVKELQDIFSVETYEDLLSLEFKLKKKKGKKTLIKNIPETNSISTKEYIEEKEQMNENSETEDIKVFE